MIAYFVHDPAAGADTLVIPEMGCSAAVDGRCFKAFISPTPDFAALLGGGDVCSTPDPERFGTVIATRREGEDLCVLKPEMWQARMDFHFSTLIPS
jgi:hypothetical protein